MALHINFVFLGASMQPLLSSRTYIDIQEQHGHQV